jgi:hypothetical protein
MASRSARFSGSSARRRMIDLLLLLLKALDTFDVALELLLGEFGCRLESAASLLCPMLGSLIPIPL